MPVSSRYVHPTTIQCALVAGDIPALDAAKITSGVFDRARIPASQFVFWLYTTGDPASTTYYVNTNALMQYYGSLHQPQWNATETTSGLQQRIPVGIVIDAMYVYLTAGPGASKSKTFTLRDDAASTSVAVTLSGAGAPLTGSWTTGGVTIAAGSLIDIMHTVTGSAHTATEVAIMIVWHMA